MARRDDIEITQVRSLIGAPPGQRRTVRSLGLRRIRHTVTQPDRPEIRGMIAKVAHLVEVRYPGEEEPVAVEPGQEPKGAGQPAAGPSITDEEAAELRAAEEEALSQPARVDEDVVVAGQTNLMAFADLSDVQKLKNLFDAFNQKRDLLHLLDRCASADGVQIFIGEESGYQVLDECSIVTAP
jgi:ribosomal protein L30